MYWSVLGLSTRSSTLAPFAPGPVSAPRKNTAPALGPRNAARRHQGRRALSLACAVFFVNRDGVLQTAPGANGARVGSAVTG